MHCTHCGTGAAEGTKYCPGCGERLGPESKNPAGPDRQGPQSAMLILGTLLLGISLSAGAFLLYLVLTGSPSEVRDASARPSEVASKHNLEQKVADPDPQALLTAAPVLPGASRLARSVSTTAGGETPTPVAGVAHLAPEPLRLLPTPQPRAARSTWSVSQGRGPSGGRAGWRRRPDAGQDQKRRSRIPIHRPGCPRGRERRSRRCYH